jgi:type IV pilus assembly protein PilY1
MQSTPSSLRAVLAAPRHPQAGSLRGSALLGVLLLAGVSASQGAPVSIDTVPLSTLSVAAAKPNIMFILDDSGSMAWDYMPDDMSSTTTYGYKSSQCNGVAYNPAITYPLPVKVDPATGVISTYADASFTNACSDGFAAGTCKNNLANSFYFKYKVTNGSKPLSWAYKSTGSVDTSTNFYKECTANVVNNSGNSNFDKIVVTAASAEAQNYANWYSYYRTRQLMMRSASGRAFANLSDNYRVGFTKISDAGVTGTDFINVTDFTAVQKNTFLNKLYSLSAQNSTPLRGALSKVGRYFANKASASQVDPVQYSCQRNFAVLSTDGYWNTGSETNSYTALDLTGQLVGQQDGTELRPMKDSGTSTFTRTTTNVTTSTKTVTTALQLQRVQTSVVTPASGCTAPKPVKISTQVQICSKDQTAVKTETFAVKTTTVTTDTYTNNALSSPGTPVSTPQETSNNDSVTTPSSALSCPEDTPWQSSGTPTTSCVAAATASTSTPAMVALTPTSSSSAAVLVSSSTSDSAATSTGGDSNTLADVAEYYWKTDLRGLGNKVVPASPTDSATWQHMSVYAIGLGVKGTLTYDRDYLSQSSGDFADLVSGAKDWPSPPVTGNGDARNVDDLWHTAVNGRGQFFSAADPNQLDDAISTTLSSIRRIAGTGSASAASTLTPVAGDDWLFLPSFTSVDWTGDLRAYKFTFDPVTKVVRAPDTSPGKPSVWSASDRLNARTAARKILFSSGTALLPFNLTNLSTAGLDASLDTRCSRATTADNLSQCNSITANAKTKVTATNLMAYLAGDRTLEMGAVAADNRVFRTRTGLLGDFVNAAPVYVGKPPFRYADAGYADYASTNSTRAAVVYAASNDGMLHAFKVGANATDSTGGTELWAFMPTAVISNLWTLADKAYGSNHRYFVDATPNVSDVYDPVNNRWRTILVGGLGAGGRSYYALDITVPDSPSLLWEISSTTTGFADLGLSYGNPLITKDKNGVWMVAFTSGTNNIASGDGVGRLYLVNALSGALIRTVATSAGDSSTPSNLGRINAWVGSVTDNTAQRIYGGDMLGNLWRFDHDDRIAPAGAEATLLGIAQTAGGVAQPIVGRPVLSQIKIGSDLVSIISVGTGRMLNANDLADATVESIYSIKDTLGDTGVGIMRAATAKLVQQTQKADHTLASLNKVDWTTNNGWFVDLSISSKERVNLDGVNLSGGVVAFASTVPTDDKCSQGGTSFLYTFDLSTGNVLSVGSFDSIIVGMGLLNDGSTGKNNLILNQADQKTSLSDGPNGVSPPQGLVKRSGWRELAD